MANTYLKLKSFFFHSGDSGSGYFVQSGSTFYINGIVSSSLFDESRNCDVSKYSIFTNVAKYHDWIIKFFGKEIY